MRSRWRTTFSPAAIRHPTHRLSTYLNVTPLTVKMNQIEFVSTDSRLAEVVDRISSEPRVAVDIESNGFFRYRERVCLVQVASAESAFIIDPLAVQDVQPLGDLLANRSVEKVFHAADYDLRSLDRDWGFRVDNLFDTGIAAAFVGSERLGLQSVVKEHAGVELAKQRKLQRSNWAIRPLRAEALKYAADDVLHLLKVREALSARLAELSRLAWVKEECARLENVRYSPIDRESAFLSIKGSRDLDERGLAVLRSLCQFRESQATRFNRPLFKVIPDYALVKLSSHPEADLSTIKGLGRFGRPTASRGLKAAIEEGLRSQPVNRSSLPQSEDSRSPKETQKFRDHLRGLKKWRSQLGKTLRLDPSLLWPRVSLERLAQDPSNLHLEVASPAVRRWQAHEFGTALERVLATMS